MDRVIMNDVSTVLMTLASCLLKVSLGNLALQSLHFRIRRSQGVHVEELTNFIGFHFTVRRFDAVFTRSPTEVGLAGGHVSHVTSAHSTSRPSDHNDRNQRPVFFDGCETKHLPFCFIKHGS